MVVLQAVESGREEPIYNTLQRTPSPEPVKLPVAVGIQNSDGFDLLCQRQQMLVQRFCTGRQVFIDQNSAAPLAKDGTELPFPRAKILSRKWQKLGMMGIYFPAASSSRRCEGCIVLRRQRWRCEQGLWHHVVIVYSAHTSLGLLRYENGITPTKAKYPALQRTTDQQWLEGAFGLMVPELVPIHKVNEHCQGRG